jgi:hypothetical protein
MAAKKTGQLIGAAGDIALQRPCRGRHHASGHIGPVGSRETPALNPRVVGSSPTRRTKLHQGVWPIGYAPLIFVGRRWDVCGRLRFVVFRRLEAWSAGVPRWRSPSMQRISPDGRCGGAGGPGYGPRRRVRASRWLRPRRRAGRSGHWCRCRRSARYCCARAAPARS